MHFKKLLFVLAQLICYFLGTAAYASSTDSVCRVEKTSVEWKYCFTPGAGKNADKLIYYFHGGGGSEKSWLDPHNYPQAIREHWERNKIDPPSVVAVSFGQFWILADRSQKPKSGLYDVFKNEVIPLVENSLMKTPVKERVLIGESMGGFNAGTYSLRNPQLFSKVALLCPALGSENADSIRDLDSYIRETGAVPSYAKFLFQMWDEYFPSWQHAHETSPLKLLSDLPTKSQVPNFFLSCGTKDEYGFFYGAEKFVKIAQEKRVKVSWHPEDNGRHCSLDLEALIGFLDEEK